MMVGHHRLPIWHRSSNRVAEQKVKYHNASGNFLNNPAVSDLAIGIGWKVRQLLPNQECILTY
jgi:hypothetical protein